MAHIREQFPEVPIIATGGPTDDTIRATIEAGANAITYTPPTSAGLFPVCGNAGAGCVKGLRRSRKKDQHPPAKRVVMILFQQAQILAAASLGLLCRALLVHRHEMALGHGDTAMNHGVITGPDTYGLAPTWGRSRNPTSSRRRLSIIKRVQRTCHRQLADIVPAQQPGAPQVAIFSTS